jgi:hypothetical protein
MKIDVMNGNGDSGQHQQNAPATPANHQPPHHNGGYFNNSVTKDVVGIDYGVQQSPVYINNTG